MDSDKRSLISEIITLAADHGLSLQNNMDFNEMGIDFRIAFATAKDGTPWVLRIPRRDDLAAQIDKEKNILQLARRHLSVAVPDWHIATPSLIAYPLLTDRPVLTFDATTYEVTWYMDRESPLFVPSLAKVLVELHQVSAAQAAASGLPIHTPTSLRQEIAERIVIVKEALGISEALEWRWQKWLDNDVLWPDFTTFVHGDLYAGHILASPEGEVTGLIDWSEGQVSDPSMDFSGHQAVFGDDSLRALVKQYEQLGGRVWDEMVAQAIERQAASPLQYGYFAVRTDSGVHREAAKIQLGVA